MDLENHEQPLATNVLSLFGHSNIEEEVLLDPMEELLSEAMILDEDDFEEVQLNTPRILVNEDSSPDQSIYVLDEQLSKLKSSLSRIRFYLGDMDDLLIR